jgi:ABC-type polysaccharide/polyol phosphate export permease
MKKIIQSNFFSLNLNYSILKSVFIIELLFYKKVFLDKIINIGSWMITWLSISSFIMNKIITHESMIENYGIFMFSGLCAGACYFELYSYILEIVSDIKNNKTIYAYLILPTNLYSILFIKFFFFPVLTLLVNIILCFIVGIICLQNIEFLKHISYIKLIVVSFSTASFFISFGFFLSTLVESTKKMSNIWNRFIFPLWFLGCFQFPWNLLYQKLNIVSYFFLLNPIVYTTEGFRSAILNKPLFLDGYMCSLILILLTFVFMFIGLKRFLKELDTIY